MLATIERRTVTASKMLRCRRTDSPPQRGILNGEWITRAKRLDGFKSRHLDFKRETARRTNFVTSCFSFVLNALARFAAPPTQSNRGRLDRGTFGDKLFLARKIWSLNQVATFAAID